MSARVAVIGAGLMGHGIALRFALAGHEVGLHDIDPDVLGSTPTRIAAALAAVGADPQVGERIELHGSAAAAVAGASFVTEAASERVGVKRAIFAELDALCDRHVILASNTSVIPIGRIAGDLDGAPRMVGTHWWNPPHLIRLVEVVQGPHTAPAVIESTLTLLREIGQEPVHVHRDVPGFVGNRLQHALWREAIALVADGVCDAETVDAVVTAGFGRRLAVMGPLETADLIGLDLTLDIHEELISDLDVTPGPSAYLRELVQSGRLGARTGQGFRVWGEGDQAAASARLLAHLGGVTAGSTSTSGEPTA